jgi:xanthosine utilization system XapX-like protein
MPFKALLFFAVLGVVLRGALLGGLFITAAGMFVGSGFLLLADRIPNIPLLGKLLVILLAVAGMLIILAAMTLGIATFLTMAWDGFVETSKLFGI